MARTRESDVLYNNGDLDGEIRQRNVDLEDANAVLEGRRTSSGGGSPAENFMERVLYLVRWMRDEFHDERELPDREMIRAAGLMGMTENPRSYLRRERRDLNGDWADLKALWTAFANRKSQILALPAQVQQRIIDFVAPWRDESLQQPFMQPRFLSGLRSAFFHLAVSSDRYFTPQRIVHGEFGIPPEWLNFATVPPSPPRLEGPPSPTPEQRDSLKRQREVREWMDDTSHWVQGEAELRKFGRFGQ
eukprot:tig00020851_g14714.t1